jgi:hypothetical protein
MPIETRGDVRFERLAGLYANDAQLQAAKVGRAQDIPNVSVDLICNCLAELKKLGLR